MFKFQKNPCLNVLAARKTKEFINDLNEKRLKIIQKNHYEVLGLAKNTPQEKIRKAYIELSKKFHPDNLFGIDLPAKMIEKVTEVFQLINESYAVLSDKKQREEYLAEEKRQERSEKKLEIDKILEAETAFQRGTILLKLNKYSEALSAYAIANQAVPEEAEYITCHAWALYKANPHNNSQSNQAEMQLKRSIAINPGIANTYLYLGTILKNKGELNEAKKQFKKAIRINPNCHESGRELRLMEMRGK
jgi:tetratricopeptide (TPR) repeat protein